MTAMLEQLLDNSFTRRLASTLEQSHNSRLGTRRTMRLAQAFNRFKNGRCVEFRSRLYQNELDALFRENGPMGSPAPPLEDGWSLDESHALPHLYQLVEDAQEIIARRGGVPRGGGDRSFFQQIATDEDVSRYQSILDFATSNEVLKPVIEYMGQLPVLSVALPLGVRLNESDAKFAPISDGKYRESQLFHRDYHASPMVYVIVALRDVTPRSGPFSILPASVSQRATDALGYGSKACLYRITDEQMYSVVGHEHLFEFIRPAGSVLLLDSSECFHYGSRDAVIPRYLMMYAFVPICRADFGDLLRKESPVPVTDDSARTRRAKYPIRPNDSRLRRLILDRHYLEEGPLDR